MAAWCFKTATLQTRYRVTHHWYWQIDTDYALLTSPRLFSTLRECVADARLNGFRGVIGRRHEPAHPATTDATESNVVSIAGARPVAHRAA